MSTATQEIIRLCEALPAHKRAEVVGFARFLLSRTEHPDDAAREARLADTKPRGKLSDFLREGLADEDANEAALLFRLRHLATIRDGDDRRNHFGYPSRSLAR